MLNIKDLRDELDKLLKDNNLINVNIDIGNINRDGVMNHKINQKTFDIYQSFIKSKYKNASELEITEYYYSDMKLVFYGEKKSMYLKRLPTKHLDFRVTNANRNKNISGARLELINVRKIDPIKFPSIDEYDNIEEYTMWKYVSRYKNSEINIKFIESDNSNEMAFSGKIDEVNFDSFMNNISYLLSKLFFIQLRL